MATKRRGTLVIVLGALALVAVGAAIVFLFLAPPVSIGLFAVGLTLGGYAWLMSDAFSGVPVTVDGAPYVDDRHHGDRSVELHSLATPIGFDAGGPSGI